MDLRTCEYCGTEFGVDEHKCPLCGRIAGDAVNALPKPAYVGARTASKPRKAKKTSKPERVPRWMWAVSSSVLGVAVLIGALYFCFSMGFFTSEEEEKPPQNQFQEEEKDDLVISPPVDEQPADQDNMPAAVPCTELTLNLSQVVLDEAGSSIFLSAIAQPADCTDSITFSSSDTSVATVDANGLVSAVNDGQATITVTCGEIQRTCIVVCEFVPELMVTLNRDTVSFTEAGQTEVLEVYDAPEAAVISYSSSDEQVITISAEGVMTAVGKGNAVITVMVDEIILTCNVVCDIKEPEHPGPYVIANEYGTKGDATLTKMGESCSLKLLDANGKEVEGVVFKSKNGGVAMVTESGKVTATGKGKTTIYTEYNGETIEYIIRCNF